MSCIHVSTWFASFGVVHRFLWKAERQQIWSRCCRSVSSHDRKRKKVKTAECVCVSAWGHLFLAVQSYTVCHFTLEHIGPLWLFPLRTITIPTSVLHHFIVSSWVDYTLLSVCTQVIILPQSWCLSSLSQCRRGHSNLIPVPILNLIFLTHLGIVVNPSVAGKSLESLLKVYYEVEVMWTGQRPVQSQDSSVVTLIRALWVSSVWSSREESNHPRPEERERLRKLLEKPLVWPTAVEAGALNWALVPEGDVAGEEWQKTVKVCVCMSETRLV